jgi:diaminopimelate epimerase
MKNIPFFKYQGTGNDFIMIDNRQLNFKNDTKLINRLCDRKFGIGADGLICLENSSDKNIDFKMLYYNADGNESSMCGNGGRCIVAFAKFLGIIKSYCKFKAIDGMHEAVVDEKMQVELKMKDVEKVSQYSTDFIVDTGSPHYIKFVENEDEIDVKLEGATIRYSKDFSKVGININFVELTNNGLKMRTYERGVEDETLSCGTGVTAAALTAFDQNLIKSNQIDILTRGGNLKIKLKRTENGYQDIWLIGPTQRVFKGEIEC